MLAWMLACLSVPYIVSVEVPHDFEQTMKGIQNTQYGLILLQSNEVGGSHAMEKEGLHRSLQHLVEAGLNIQSLITDRHSMIQRYMRLEHADIEHFYDVWHIGKGKLGL